MQGAQDEALPSAAMEGGMREEGRRAEMAEVSISEGNLILGIWLRPPTLVLLELAQRSAG